MPKNTCDPTEHDFDYGGSYDDGEEYSAWLFCKRCTTLAQVPIDSTKSVVLIPPEGGCHEQNP